MWKKINLLKNSDLKKNLLVFELSSKKKVVLISIKSNLKISDIERTFKVNLYPGIYLTSRVGEEMVKKKWGRIVNLGSIGVKFGGGMSNLPYSLSKFGLEFFPNNTKKWIKDNVFINTLRVGATDTKLHNLLCCTV